MNQAENLRTRRLRFRRRRRERNVEAAMTVVEHLRELRSRLIFSLVAFVVISGAAFTFYEPMLDFLLRPLCAVPRELLGPQGCRLVFVKPLGAFLFRLQMTALAGIALSSPVWLYQLYAFILPALTPKERRYSIPFLVSSVTLFLIGSAFAYLTLSNGVRFLIGIGGEQLVPLLGAQEYLNFVGLMLLGFGVTFQLPLVLIFLGLADVVTAEGLRRQRKVALVAIFVAAAVVTPSQDPYTMSVLAVPLYLLFEVTLLILARVERRRAGRTSTA
jgi:sec-independent protein translocase protein TatC